MRGFTLPALAIGLLLCACSGGSVAPESSSASAPRLAALATFDSRGLDVGVQLPDFSPYWRGAAARNGNTLPYKTSIETCHLVVRVTADGKLAIYRSGAFHDSTLTGMAAAIQGIADANFNKTVNASYAEVVLLADCAAPIRSLLEICDKLTATRVANLSIATQDRDSKCTRLMPLFIDLTQTGESFYNLAKDQLSVVSRLNIKGSADSREVLFRQLDGKVSARAIGALWGQELCKVPTVREANIQRLQVELTPDQCVAEFAEVVNQLATRGIARFELWLPALEGKSGTQPEKRFDQLASYADPLEIAKRIALPTVTQLWEPGRGDRMARPARVDENTPVVAIALKADGTIASRRPGAAWLEHGNDASLLTLMRECAEESFDLELMVSHVQVVLGADFHIQVKQVLAIQEMLVQARLRVLLLLALDNVGPTPRLLDISLPAAGSPESKLAILKISRDDTSKEFAAELQVSGQTMSAQGPAWLTDLAQLALATKVGVPKLAVSASGVSVATLLAALDAAAPLGFQEVRLVP